MCGLHYPQVYQGGLDKHEGYGGWTTFTEGECLYFHLNSKKLTMFSVQKNKKFAMDIATTVPAYYIHFNLHTRDTKISLESLGEDEREHLLED